MTLLAVAWSVPNYSAAVPSWYNLFLATFGAGALLAWLDSGRLRWIFVSGICCGLSIVVKIAGLYFMAAALLFFSSMSRKRQNPHGRPGDAPIPCC